MNCLSSFIVYLKRGSFQHSPPHEHFQQDGDHEQHKQQVNSFLHPESSYVMWVKPRKNEFSFLLAATHDMK
jgi:hypothetical protein